MGKLVLFDQMENVRFNGTSHENPLIFIFESVIVILNSEASEIVLMQKVNNEERVSSVYADETNNSIVVNFTTLQLPEITFDTGNRILLQKWTKILKLFVERTKGDDNHPFYGRSAKSTTIGDFVPLIQVSTNSWNLLSDYQDAIPESIRKFNKLTSKGLELPFDYLNRQISRPQRVPINFILAIPLMNPEDSETSNSAFVKDVQKMLGTVFESLEEKDRIGLIFLGKNEIDTSLGHYYGMAPKSWGGWREVLNSITEASVSNNSSHDQWSEGLRYLETLVNLGFLHDNDSINEIVFISSEITGNRDEPILRWVSDQSSSGWRTKRRRTSITVGQLIEEVCSKYNATFCSILLADEFKFGTEEQLNHHRTLVQGKTPGVYTNRLKEWMALDFRDLQGLLERILSCLQDITVRQIITTLKVPEGVRLLGFEDEGEILSIGEEQNEVQINFTNLESGYDRSIMFTVGIELDKLDQMEKGGKFSVASVQAKILPSAYSGQSLLTSDLDVRLAPGDIGQIARSAPLNLTISSKDMHVSEGSDNVKLPIVSRLSAVSDAFFIKRKVELLVSSTIKDTIFNTKVFNYTAKENIKMKLKELINQIGELSKTSNESNTANISNNNFKGWADDLIEVLGDILEGYSMRNHQLSNHKSFGCYLSCL
ncbi:DEKNAAC104719 [Brettanomyces naardenensis]|uniref:DEKNAAC104719 n=1 Tax=Brettanomyces naardenensis TaxID=13370 RepID=A0A448YRQ1_BRENA|nr:DEKNAAC104719 [Brettanomyces naardenensis]